MMIPRCLRGGEAPTGMLLFVLSLAAGSCHRPADEPIRECTTYSAAYAQCMQRLDPTGGAARVEKLHRALESQALGASDERREEIRSECGKALEQLRQSCR